MRILLDDTAAVVIDYQERLMPVMFDKDSLIERSVTLLKGLNILGVPMFISEQYVEKTEFSLCDNSEMMAEIEAMGKKNIIVCGIEAHVCVLQTVVDLKARGYNVILVTDCITSRKENDRKYAIKRARDEGAVLTTSEAILFELLRKSGGDTFKAISKLVK